MDLETTRLIYVLISIGILGLLAFMQQRKIHRLEDDIEKANNRFWKLDKYTNKYVTALRKVMKIENTEVRMESCVSLFEEYQKEKDAI